MTDNSAQSTEKQGHTSVSDVTDAIGGSIIDAAIELIAKLALEGP